MSSPVVLAEVTGSRLEPGRLLALVDRAEAGATSLFVGTVRNHDPEATGEVVALGYTAHPSAADLLPGIVADVLARLDPDGHTRVAAQHRVGHLVVGDAAFVVAVSAPHRRLAFDVCEQVVEQVKRRLPVWKQQFTSDGGYRWSGLGT